MVFWILISFVALAMTALLGLVLLRAHSVGEPPAAYDLRVYRQQLSDVDKDLQRGVINESDAQRIRTEVSRRILAADAQLQNQNSGSTQPRGLSRVTVLLSAALLTGGTLLLYAVLGAPGYGDMGLASRIEAADLYAQTRPNQAEAESKVPAQTNPDIEPGYADLVEQLRQTAGQRPDDAQGQALLAQHEANLGNFVAAYQAKENYIRIMSGDLEPQDYGELAELMIMAAGGYVSPEAEELLDGTLQLDPRNGPARYYYGLLQGQLNRPDIAFRIWADTLRQGPKGAPWIDGIEAQIEEMAFRAGVDYNPITPPAAPDAAGPALAGPSAEDLSAAQEMTMDERQEMIQGMVARLSDRLATEGGTAPEWAQLIGALGVLGEQERAKAIYTEAKTRFASDAEALVKLEAAASMAGLEP
ncbi:cytochrome c-type biogenesis protein CycH [Roseobacter sp. MED193]|uniref:c-type cytochrome biogenesis protein CcmI n=1 Tax=Roseobacter sp. MED193 TaxID=314262 RepID=UPI000068AD67|nr:c-type cytochrome biogenesis protein CcmI [Roseobacter sp. MED193]EAQ45225.1 cytochrome c-type biogenesis protein CycH [Roseobacter sp. MED193]